MSMPPARLQYPNKGRDKNMKRNQWLIVALQPKASHSLWKEWGERERDSVILSLDGTSATLKKNIINHGNASHLFARFQGFVKQYSTHIKGSPFMSFNGKWLQGLWHKICIIIIIFFLKQS